MEAPGQTEDTTTLRTPLRLPSEELEKDISAQTAALGSDKHQTMEGWMVDFDVDSIFNYRSAILIRVAKKRLVI